MSVLAAFELVWMPVVDYVGLFEVFIVLTSFFFRFDIRHLY